MVEQVLCPRLCKLLDAGAQLVDVLPSPNMPSSTCPAVGLHTGKDDWLARALAREGEKRRARAIDCARQGTATVNAGIGRLVAAPRRLPSPIGRYGLGA